jgi:hypothetical protein
MLLLQLSHSAAGRAQALAATLEFSRSALQVWSQQALQVFCAGTAAARQILQLVVADLAHIEVAAVRMAEVKPLTVAAGVMARLSVSPMPISPAPSSSNMSFFTLWSPRRSYAATFQIERLVHARLLRLHCAAVAREDLPGIFCRTAPDACESQIS